MYAMLLKEIYTVQVSFFSLEKDTERSVCVIFFYLKKCIK